MAAASPTERLAAARAALVHAGGAVGLVVAPAHAPDAPRVAYRPGRGPIATGIALLDDALGGGLPRGRIVEIVGGRSSGRLSLTLALLSRAIHAGEPAALIDAADALDPRSLHPDDRRRLLWVRPDDALTAARCADLVLDGGGFGLVALYLVGARSQPARARAALDRAAAHASRTRAPDEPFAPVQARAVTAKQGLGPAAWARLAQRASKARSAVLVVLDAQDAHVNAPGVFAHATIEARGHRAAWQGRALLETVRCQVTVTRNRLGGGAGASTDVLFAAEDG